VNKVIVKRADGTLELRDKNAEGRVDLADGEALVSYESDEGFAFLKAEGDRQDRIDEVAAETQRLGEIFARRQTPAARQAVTANGTTAHAANQGTGTTAVLERPADEAHRTGEQTGTQRDLSQLREVTPGVFEARMGLGIEVYNRMTSEESRAGCDNFAHFLFRSKFDQAFAERRIKLARRVDADLVDSSVGMQQRALAEGSTGAGGALVPPQFIQELLDIARAEAVAFQAGVQMRPTNSNLVDMPALTTSATAAWVSENGAIAPSDQVFAQQSTSISKLGAGVKISNELIADADPSIIQIVQEDLGKVIGLRLDLGILEGSGSAPEIRGIANTAGVTAGASLGANGGTPTLNQLLDTMYNLYAVNIADEDRWSVVFHPRALNSLRKIVDTTGNYILSSASGVNAPVSRPRGLIGLPYYMSTQLSIARTVGTSTDCTNIYLGRFHEMIAFMSGAFTIDLSNAAADATNSAWWSDQTWLRAKQRVGFLVRRPAGIAVISGVRP
jgi:HK97 family phage major capsid protein